MGLPIDRASASAPEVFMERQILAEAAQGLIRRVKQERRVLSACIAGNRRLDFFGPEGGFVRRQGGACGLAGRRVFL